MNRIVLMISFIMGTQLFLQANNHVKIHTITPKKAQISVPVEVEGKTEPVIKHLLNAPFDGILQTKITNNQKVKKGAVIALVENKTLLNKKNLLGGNVTNLQKQLLLENKKLHSADEMLQMGLISQNDHLTQQLIVEEKKVNLANIQNELKDLEELLELGVIRSPIDGYISDLVANGSYLAYANTICQVNDANVYIKLYVPVTQSSDLYEGQNVSVNLNGRSIKATLMQILPNATNNLIEAIATSESDLPVGLNVQASIEMMHKHGWIIPKDSIVLIQNKPAVYVIQNNVAKLQFVHIQKDMIDTVLLSDELSENMKIVSKNAYMIQDGTVVEEKQ